MKPNDVLKAFEINFEEIKKITSLYAYAPVYRFSYAGRDYVIKRTGVRSDKNAIAAWTNYLVYKGIKSVAPVQDFGQNPRCLSNKSNKKQENWVIYPFIRGIPYTGNTAQILAAGRLLGQIHAVGMETNFNLKVSKTVVAIEIEKIEAQIKEVCLQVEQNALEYLSQAKEILTFYSQHYLEKTLPKLLKIELPLTNCSWDYKAANLIYQTDSFPVLIDPDHCGRIPRMYDLATALILFHCDYDTAPKRMFTLTEWQTFLAGYRQFVLPTVKEIETWQDVLLCAWIDQALWLLSHFPEGWANAEEQNYLINLLAVDLSQFSLK